MDDKMMQLIEELNKASSIYYNTGQRYISDQEFDAMLAQLKKLEETTGTVMANSPTVNVGSSVLDSQKKVELDHLMLSLDKCHSEKEVSDFSNGRNMIAMTKADGCSATLKYVDGELISACTRGNGYVGQDITSHAKLIKNIPLKINKMGTFIIDGEIVIKDDDFEIVNKNNDYENSRNLVAGTLNALDTSLVKKRGLSFLAWDVIEGFDGKYLSDNLLESNELGFETVCFMLDIPVIGTNNITKRETLIKSFNETIRDISKKNNIPQDGVVWKFNDIAYGKSLGRTDKFFRNGIAYKFPDEAKTTILRKILWQAENKFGTLSPVAVFDPVRIEGSTVERASLHNVSIMKALNIAVGERVEVIKSNMIIPQIVSCDAIEYDFEIPSVCPVCGKPTELRKDNSSEVLYCTNPNCKGKLLGKLVSAVGRDAWNIDGLSEATLRTFIDLGWLNNISDIYTVLPTKKTEIMNLDGFGRASAEKLINAIDKSRTMELDKFINGLSIPFIGKKESKTIADKCIDNYRSYGSPTPLDFFITYGEKIAWNRIDGIGDVKSSNIKKFIRENMVKLTFLYNEITILINEKHNTNKLKGMVFVITGTVELHKNRAELQQKIESNGGKVTGSVTKKTDYLINNDTESTSGKNKKAKELGIPVISEKELLDMIGE